MNASLHRHDSRWAGVARVLDGAASLEASDVVRRLYGESRLGQLSSHIVPDDVPSQLRSRPVDANARRIALPEPLATSQSLQGSLDARTAVRTYAPDAIGLAELGTLLRAAADGDRYDWPDEEAAGVGLRLIVVEWRVDRLEPAVWVYEPRTHALAYVGNAPTAGEAPALTLQLEFTTAPALIFISGGLAAACARYGSWGHRQLLLRAGAAGQRLWLSAIGIGLSGSIFAGFLPRAADRFAAIDGYLQANLLAFAVGYPAHRAHDGEASAGKGGMTIRMS